MGKRGSETRQKIHSVLVRLTRADYALVALLAKREGTNRAEYFRRRIETPTNVQVSRAASEHGLSEVDRILLAGATRSMGHLAGLMKLAILKSPALGRSTQLQSLFEVHHRELQALQGKIRALLEGLE